MHLPNGQAAYIPAPKLTHYLLSESHPVGRTKARFFRSRGFDSTNVDLLTEALLNIARHREVVATEVTRHGTKYVVDGIIEGPTGRSDRVRTVWIADVGDDRPRFVTACPRAARPSQEVTHD